MLPGKKTYLIAGAIVLYAATGYFLGNIGQDEALKLIFEGLGLSALRAGVKKSGLPQDPTKGGD